MVAAVIDLSQSWMPPQSELQRYLRSYVRQLKQYVDGPVVLLGEGYKTPDAVTIDVSPNFRAPDLSSVLESAGVTDDTYVVSPGCVYSDDLSNHVKLFQQSDETARLVYAQPGSEHVIVGKDFLNPIADIRLTALPQLIRHMARDNPAVIVEVTNPPSRNAYLKLDLPEGRRFIAEYGDRPREEWRIGPESHQLRILNTEKMRNMARKMSTLVDLEDKTVLEVGPARDFPIVANMLLDDYGVRSYTGVNIDEFAYFLDGPNARVIQKDIYKFEPDRKYDLVFSFAVLEHVPDPVRFMHMIPDWLRVGGHHYGIYFVWSSALGHHIPNSLIGYEYIKHFDHLTHDENAIRAKLAEGDVPQDAIEEIARRMFHDSYVNRERAKNVLDAMLTCGLEPIMIDPRNRGRLHGRAKRLDTGGEFTPEELSIEGFEFLLRKSEFDWRGVATSLEPTRKK